MELKTFAEAVAGELQKNMGENFEISVLTTLKNNSTEYTGISIQKKRDVVSPTIYVEDLYEKFRKNEITITQAVTELIDRYEDSIRTMSEIRQISVAFEQCKNNIIYRLVSAERNKAILENMPYIPFLDMAITFHLVVSVTDYHIQSIRISSELQKSWNISIEQLYKLAKENTKRLFPAETGEIKQWVEKHIDPEYAAEQWKDIDLTNPEKIDMIVISNESGINGASVLLYDGVIDKIAEKYESDLYVLPSSIHEIIVVPAYDRSLHDVFTVMVKKINRNFVEKDEILSDRVYIYLRDEKKFI